MRITILDKRLARLKYEKLISNCDKAIDRSDDDWSFKYWNKVKEQLRTNMSKLGLLKGSKIVN